MPVDHLVYFLLDVIQEVDVSLIINDYTSDKGGQPPFHPRMMLVLLGSERVRSSEADHRTGVWADQALSGIPTISHAWLGEHARRMDSGLHDSQLAQAIQARHGFSRIVGLGAGFPASFERRVSSSSPHFLNWSHLQVHAIRFFLRFEDREFLRENSRRQRLYPGTLLGFFQNTTFDNISQSCVFNYLMLWRIAS